MKIPSSFPKNFCFLICGFLIMSLLGCTAQKGKVYLVPSLHGLHKVNDNYTYDSLSSVIRRINPDVIAVEIRPEDSSGDSIYLSKNYPYEMWMMKYWFPHSQVLGFDWFGNDIKGKPLPENYWQEIAWVKKMETELSSDRVYSKKRGECSPFVQERVEILKNSSLPEILKSRDALLTKEYYICLATQYKGSKYEALLDFYEQRNKELMDNINGIIKRNKNKTIVIVTGDDHFVFFKDVIRHKPLFD